MTDNPSILVVDDEADSRSLLTGLKRYNGVGNGQYISWNTTSNTWAISKLAKDGITNEVALVCSHPD
jgi:hypothetical protein